MPLQVPKACSKLLCSWNGQLLALFLDNFNINEKKKGVMWGWERDIIHKEAIAFLVPISALNKCTFPNGHLTRAWLQLCSGFQPGCASRSPAVVLGTNAPQSFPLPCLEMHPQDDQNEGFPTTWHEWTPKTLVMGETLLHNKTYTHPITSSHWPAPVQTLTMWADACLSQDRGACVLGT